MAYRVVAVVTLAAAVSGCGRVTAPISVSPDTPARSFIVGPAAQKSIRALQAALWDAREGPAAIHSEGAADPASRWNLLTTELGVSAKLPPPSMARAYALVHVAIHDGLAAGGARTSRGPVASAAGAGAASIVLEYLFPTAVERIAAEVRGQVADTSPRSALARAWALGRAVGALVVEHGRSDGSSAPYDGTIPTGPGLWTGSNPVLPQCGNWRCWIAVAGEVQPEPPHVYGSPDDLADVAAVYESALHRTPRQVAIVHKWADRPPPTIWNSYLLERVVPSRLTPNASARAFAFLNVAMYDAFVSCWRTKYTFWTARPFQRIPGLVTVIPTPNFPSYTSGHSTISAAAAAVLGEVFPNERQLFDDEAAEAAMSRLWGGIHFPKDNVQGAAVGRRIGARVVAIMQGVSNAGDNVATR